jgi:hypothetical protein
MKSTFNTSIKTVLNSLASSINAILGGRDLIEKRFLMLSIKYITAIKDRTYKSLQIDKIRNCTFEILIRQCWSYVCFLKNYKFDYKNYH